MKYNIKKMIKWVAVGAFAFVAIASQNNNTAMADGYGLTVAPMNQNVVIDPGDSHEASFRISNPSASTQDTYYEIDIEPFYKTESGEATYEANGDRSKIVNWVTLNVPAKGKLAPNEVKEIVFTIDVPESAPSGGQYMSILVTAKSATEDDESELESIDNAENAATIKETKRIAHVVYTEITGDTVKQGVISNMSLPSFLLSGNITGSASVRNTGNVHGDAKYTLQVFPLFSSEEVYTNEEEPATFTILPDRENYAEVSWEGTPSIGIFNTVFTVEYEGESQQLSKMIIVCPIWLLFLIIFIVFAIIIWIVLRAKQRSKKPHKPATATEQQ